MKLFLLILLLFPIFIMLYIKIPPIATYISGFIKSYNQITGKLTNYNAMTYINEINITQIDNIEIKIYLFVSSLL